MTNPDYTHLAIVADRSGSMQPIAADMNGAIRKLLAEQAALPGELHVTAVTFDSAVDVPFDNVRADEIKVDLIDPRGGTALSDAIAFAVRLLGSKFSEMAEDARPGKVIVVIVTDGEENSSLEFAGAAGAEKVKAMVEKQRDQFQWEFLFLGAGIDAFTASAGYGVGRGQTMSFDHSKGGTQVFASAVSGYATRSRLTNKATEFTEAERTGEEA